MMEVKPGGSQSTPVASQEAGGREEHAPMGSSSAWRSERGRHPSKEVRDLHCRQRLGPAGEGQSPWVRGWSHTLQAGHQHL